MCTEYFYRKKRKQFKHKAPQVQNEQVKGETVIRDAKHIIKKRHVNLVSKMYRRNNSLTKLKKVRRKSSTFSVLEIVSTP